MSKMEDSDACRQAYEDVRKDDSTTKWCCIKYNEESALSLEGSGEEFDDLKANFGEDERVFAFLRVQTGDELSKRSKFVFITWTGPNVSGLKKAKMSTDKAVVKAVWPSFAVELLLEELKEVEEDAIKEKVMKAGGANYGTGQ